MVPRMGFEPIRPRRPPDSKSGALTVSPPGDRSLFGDGRDEWRRKNQRSAALRKRGS